MPLLVSLTESYHGMCTIIWTIKIQRPRSLNVDIVSHRLCRSSQVRVGDAFGGFGVGFLDDVGVDIRRGGYGGVPEALRHGDDIRALIYEN